MFLTAFLKLPWNMLCLGWRSKSKSDERLAIIMGEENRTWLQVDHEINSPRKTDGSFWWTHIGSTLGALLLLAGYTPEAQHRHLRLFGDVIAPSLGAVPSHRHWKSFMTDEGNPVELSYEWPTSTNGAHHRIRFSIEPIGPRAGTLLDYYNKVSAQEFVRTLFDALPNVDLQWFTHLERELSCGQHWVSRKLSEPSSHRFYAFDLGDEKTMVKAYFFPRLKAREESRPVLDVISDVILTAPNWGEAETQAWRKFQAFADRPRVAPLEFDMLAVDLVEPRQSRIKLYFRSRDTDFESVIDNLTLGQSARTDALEKGLESLRALWDALFQVNSVDGTSLPLLDHRTAGVLFNVEFKLGAAMPVTKIYIPVRHYSSSDQHIMQTLAVWLRSNDSDYAIQNYNDIMDALL